MGVGVSSIEIISSRLFLSPCLRSSCTTEDDTTNRRSENVMALENFMVGLCEKMRKICARSSFKYAAENASFYF